MKIKISLPVMILCCLLVSAQQKAGVLSADELKQVVYVDFVQFVPTAKHVNERVTHFAKVVRRNIRGHADGDPR